MKCEKCGYESEDNKSVESESEDKIYLCSVCRKFTPSDKIEFKNYLEEKLDWKTLETFRKSSKKAKEGMSKKARKGQIVSRAAFGYKIENKNLIPDEQKRLIVQKIFMDFLNQDISLNKLASKYNFSVNGLKKILKNFTYVGKIKFDRQILEGKHQPIISAELFNKVQNKLENLNIK